jgi:hypothetical protein
VEEPKQEKPDEFAELRAKYRKIAVYRTEEGVCVFKKPTGGDYDRYVEKLAGDKKNGTKLAAARELCHSCLVFPAREELQRIFDELPGLPLSIAGELSEMVGVSLQAEGKGQ